MLTSLLVTLLTFSAEVGGIALALELASSVNYLLWVPVAGLALWLVIWRVKFSVLENVAGVLGLALVVFGVALWQLHPDWSQLVQQAVSPRNPPGEGLPTYFYYAIALFGAAMTPYEVFFFSSGGVEERWSAKDIVTSRMNVFVGFPLGGLLSLAIAACAAVVLMPRQITVDTLGQVGLPVAVAPRQARARVRDPRVDVDRTRAELAVDPLEGWVERHIIGRLPGSGHAG